jgi:hypothetical protein
MSTFDDDRRKWLRLNLAYAMLAELRDQLPPEVQAELALWTEAMEAVRAAAIVHHAILAERESDTLGHWLNRICGPAAGAPLYH